MGSNTLCRGTSWFTILMVLARQYRTANKVKRTFPSPAAMRKAREITGYWRREELRASVKAAGARTGVWVVLVLALVLGGKSVVLGGREGTGTSSERVRTSSVKAAGARTGVLVGLVRALVLGVNSVVLGGREGTGTSSERWRTSSVKAAGARTGVLVGLVRALVLGVNSVDLGGREGTGTSSKREKTSSPNKSIISSDVNPDWRPTCLLIL